MVKSTWRALIDDVIHGRPWAESDAAECAKRAGTCSAARAALSHLFYSLMYRMEGMEGSRHRQRNSRQLCLPFVQCSTLPASHVRSLLPDARARIEMVCRPIDDPCDDSTGEVQRTACAADPGYPGTLERLCVHHPSRWFWSEMASALAAITTTHDSEAARKRRVAMATASLGKQHAEAGLLVERGWRHRILGNASRAFWMSLSGKCAQAWSTDGLAGLPRVWC
jgi:hypothetical protein